MPTFKDHEFSSSKDGPVEVGGKGSVLSGLTLGHGQEGEGAGVSLAGHLHLLVLLDGGTVLKPCHTRQGGPTDDAVKLGCAALCNQLVT